jgi:hypothetical protein
MQDPFFMNTITALPHFTCERCAGMGTVPYDIGSVPCWSCDGSGLIEPGQRLLARVRIAEILNRAEESSPHTPRRAISCHKSRW